MQIRDIVCKVRNNIHLDKTLKFFIEHKRGLARLYRMRMTTISDSDLLGKTLEQYEER